jgi:O-antigen ligase
MFTYIKNFPKFLLFAILGLPFFLITGPFFPDLIYVISSLYFLIYFYFNKKKVTNLFFFEKNILLFLIFFFLLLLYSAILSDYYLNSIRTSFFYLRYYLFSFILFFLLIDNKFFFKNYSYFFFIILIILFIDSSYQKIFHYNLLGQKQITVNRVSSFFGKNLILGSYTLKLLPVFLTCLALSNIKKKKFFSVSGIFISGYLIFLSGERVAATLYLLFLFMLLFVNTLRKYIVFLFIFILLFSISFFYQSPQLQRLFKGTYEQLFLEKNYTDKKISIFSERHEDHYLTAYYIFKDNMFIGAGPNTFRYNCENPKYAEKIQERIIKRNTIVATEDGFIGFVGFNTLKNNFNEEIILDLNQALTLNMESIDLDRSKIILNENENKRQFDYSAYKILIFSNNKFYKNQEVLVKNNLLTNGCTTHPHNFFMQIISEIGLVGLLFFFVFLFFIIKEITKTISSVNINNDYLGYYLLLISFFINLFPFLPSGNFFNNKLNIILYLPLGIFFFIRKKLQVSK